MELLASEALAEHQFNKKQRLYDDTTTWLAEALDGNMRTEFRFYFDGEELYGQDGGAMSTVFNDALVVSEDLPDNLSFERRRRKYELDEYHEMVRMMQGAEYNTMVVVSDFPQELMDSQQDVGGYNYQRRQTMLRVITKNTDGSLTMQTQSLDKSNRGALEAIYHSLGYVPQPGELLGQRMHLHIDDQRQEQLLDDLVAVYDDELALNYGGQWRAGRDVYCSINTYNFVRQQDDLISYYSSWANHFGDNQAVLYGVVATIKNRYKIANNSSALVDMSEQRVWRETGYDLYGEMRVSVAESLLSGDRFSGCGLTVGGLDGTEGQLSEAGYGNKTEHSQSYQFNKKMYCVVCQAPPKKEKEPKKMCGPCGICRSCDSRLQSKI